MSEDSALRFLALLNELWDARTVDRWRETRACATIKGRRFTVFLMMQPQTLARLVAAGDGIARGVGALARLLMAWPQSTMGTRAYREGDLDCPELCRFDNRLRDLLNLPLPLDPDGGLDPPALELSPDAFAIWRSTTTKPRPSWPPLASWSTSPTSHPSRPSRRPGSPPSCTWRRPLFRNGRRIRSRGSAPTTAQLQRTHE